MVVSKKFTVLVAAIILLAVGLFNTVGRTYAFNVIKSANTGLDISLKKLINKEAVDSDDSWIDIVGKDVPVFSYDKWEPGAMRASVLKVTNTANSAAECEHALYLYATKGGTSMNLADVMSVYLYKGLYEPDTANKRPDLSSSEWIPLGRMKPTAEEQPNNLPVVSLETNSSQIYTIVMKMDESADDRYQGAEANVYAVVRADSSLDESVT